MGLAGSWVMGGRVVAAVFLVANQLIVRGVAVGISDADGEPPMFPWLPILSWATLALTALCSASSAIRRQSGRRAAAGCS